MDDTTLLDTTREDEIRNYFKDLVTVSEWLQVDYQKTNILLLVSN